MLSHFCPERGIFTTSLTKKDEFSHLLSYIAISELKLGENAVGWWPLDPIARLRKLGE